MIPVGSPHSTPDPAAGGEVSRETAHRAPVKAVESPSQGVGHVPIWANGSQIGCRPGGSSVGVPGPGCRGSGRRPLRPGREMRAEHLDEGHGAVAELLVEAAYDGRREQGQLGGPGRRVGADDEPAVGEGLRRAVAPTSAPTSSGQRAKTPRTRSSSSQPWSATSRSSWCASSCGSRSSGWAPETLASRGRRPAWPGACGPAGGDFAVARVSCRARSRPSSVAPRCRRLVGRLVSHRGSPPRRRRRTALRPARRARPRAPPR